MPDRRNHVISRLPIDVVRVDGGYSGQVQVALSHPRPDVSNAPPVLVSIESESLGCKLVLTLEQVDRLADAIDHLTGIARGRLDA